MNCQHCGSPMAENERFCPNCGAAVPETPVVPAAPAAPVIPAAPKPFTQDDLPSEYRPLSPWAYFGLQILYSIPLVGFIFLIIFSFKSDNLNRRNFTRSYWCGLLIVGIVAVVALIVMFVLAAVLGTGLSMEGIESMM